MEPIQTTEAVVSGAGMLKADTIIHAVGPRFREANLEEKLRDTIMNSLKQAENKKIKKIAFPAMGAGFYGVPLKTCARVMFDTFTDYLNGDTKIEEVVICLLDNREYRPFQEQLASLLEEEK